MFIRNLILSLTSLVLLVSCTKDPEIIIEKEIVTVTDTVIITNTVVDTVIVIDTITVIETILETIPDTATTYILVRHAETTGIGSNPSLSAAGMARATELQRILENVNVDAVFSTNFNRTEQTAAPTALAKGLTLIHYDPFAPDAVIDNTLVSYKEGIVLIVGHSNTTPDFLNVMVGENLYPDIAESVYDNLFVVHVFEKGRAKVVHMKYGD